MKKKGYAWKACNRHKRFPSSNLGHSAFVGPKDINNPSAFYVAPLKLTLCVVFWVNIWWFHDF